MILILDNELVKKYFGCDPKCKKPNPMTCRLVMARDVLDAMQKPIKPGEKSLVLHPIDNTWVEETSVGCDSPRFFSLRLPEKFQKQKCECWICPSHEHKDCDQAKFYCPCKLCHQFQNERMELEKEIKRIWNGYPQDGVKHILELVLREKEGK